MAAADQFCGRCGQRMEAGEDERSIAEATARTPVSGRLDLVRLIAEAAAEDAIASTETKGHVTQEDIRALIAKRRRKG